ncbi:hypothetical protein [Undibacterium umbellatum]|uniref:Uncharacterized protein n=1 Tax=Undibacterium umbellatum TaxID=2762300 RepID=A0ABR6ZGT1_9BURK|nr:hypothetical protein [Undibacterium umbellatum]MBC3910540.1 hypothetical protein [Undibacterium umbellatum]
MKIRLPVLWGRPAGVDYGAKQLKLSEILPTTGQTINAYFSEDDSPVYKENPHVLWTPPLTEMNDWSDNPSEILHSYIVTGQVKFLRQVLRGNEEATPLERMIEKSLEYELLITDVQPILKMCDLVKTMSPELWQERYGSKTLSGLLQVQNSKETLFDYINDTDWARVNWAGMANAGSYIFLSFNRHELHYETLLQQEGNQLFVHYFSFTTYRQSDRYITRKKLSAKENEGIKSLMARAVALKDSFGDYLLIDV